MNRQNYNILAGEGDILRILKEIDKAENRESIGAGIQKLLEVLGNYGNADRTYLFEMVHTPEIFTKGVPDGTALAEEIDTLLGSSLSQAASRPALSKGEPLA